MDSTIILSIEDLNTVQLFLKEVRYMWKLLGLGLGLDFATLEVIESDCPRTDDRFIQMLAKWLRNSNEACWKNLTAALQSLGIKVLLGTHLYPFSLPFL